MRFGVSFFVLAAINSAPTPAEDLRTRQADVCIDFSASAQARIESCSWLIGRGGLRTANLAIAHHNRGVARQDLGDFAGALADLTAAIQLAPSARAYFARGWLRCELSWQAADRGDAAGSRAALANGEADLRRAIAIDPSVGSLEGFCY